MSNDRLDNNELNPRNGFGPPFDMPVQDVEDPELEAALMCLAPSPDLPGRIRRELPSRPRRVPLIRWIIPAAALLLIGLALGAFTPLAPLRPIEEAEASLLRDNIAGYSQSSSYFAQEAGLLSSIDDNDIATELVRQQFQIASLRPTAVWIRENLRDPDPQGWDPAEREVLRRFFDNAVLKIDELNSVIARPQLTRSDIEWIGATSSRIVPPEQVRSTASRQVLSPAIVRGGDSRFSGYINARRFMLCGDTAKAISAFSAAHDSSDGVMQQLSGFWLTHCYLESGNRERAVMMYRSLPGEFQRRLSLPSGSLESHGTISISITVPQHRNYESLHVLRTGQQTVVVSVYPDGSVKVSDNGISEEIYPTFGDFKEARADLYRRIFTRDAE